MKAWILIVGILVIFAILFSPVLAISKLDLIALYKGESAPDMKPTVFIHDFTTPSPTPTPTPYIPSAWAIPTPFPSPVKSYFPSWFVKSTVKPTITPTPTDASSTSYEDTGGYIPCPPGVPVGELIQSFGMCVAYTNSAGDIIHGGCINPETGYSYPIGIDALGNSYLVKPGCQCTWA